MSSEAFDTIVVGARCAGAPLATLLARAGQKILLLDAAKLPSDQPMSTHFVQARGVEWLDELGVGAEVRRLSPANFFMGMDLDGVRLRVPYPGGRAAHCLRRSVLDALLQNAAVAAGAVLRDRSKVTGLVREGDRVVGVSVGETVYRARIVVGADGRHSTIAELTGAKEIVGYDSPRFGYWGYWPVTDAWRNPERRFDAFLHFGMPNDQTLRFIFQTDADLLLLGATPLLSDLPKWKGRHEAAYLEALAACPITAPLIANNTRQGDLLGLLKARYYMREAIGPGYALVGDSGLHKDPAPGWGITDALRDARNLATAIVDGSDAALLRYAKQRNLDSIELFHFAADFGGTAYRNPLNRVALDHLQRSPALMARIGGVLDREVSPYEAVPTLKVLLWALGALARGNGSVLGSFFTSARRTIEVRRARDICIRELASCGNFPSAAQTNRVS